MPVRLARIQRMHVFMYIRAHVSAYACTDNQMNGQIKILVEVDRQISPTAADRLPTLHASTRAFLARTPSDEARKLRSFVKDHLKKHKPNTTSAQIPVCSRCSELRLR